MAKDVSARTGIPWQVILAVGANETGWGQYAKGNNFFGIKGQNPQTGASFQAGTWEEENGQRVNITDTFRAYDSAEQSFQDFADFIHNNPRYQPALDYLKSNPNDWRGFAHMLQDEGYATAHNWADQVVSIGNGFPDDGSVQPSPLTMGTNQGGASQGGVSSVIDVGSSAIGSRYQWGGAGGRSDFGDQLANTDCSGFVSWAYEKATGIRLPAQTSAIYASTMAIRPEEAQPGDLIEFGMNQNDPASQHVAIYAGNGMMLHDSSVNPNGGVDLTPIWQGGEFRRVPGVDPSLRSAASAGPDIGANDQWFVSSQGGRLVYQGITADGQGYTYDLGPTDQPENAVLGGSFQQQPAPQPAPQGGGNEVGAGAEAPPKPTLSKAKANYFAYSPTRHCQDCAMFVEGGACTLVKGDIEPRGTCDHFERATSKMGAGQEDSTDSTSADQTDQSTPDPRRAPVVVQELHELRDPQAPLPGDQPAPPPNTYQIPTAADVTNATTPEAVPVAGRTAAAAADASQSSDLPPTSGAALAGQFAMDRPLGGAPPVTPDAPPLVPNAATQAMSKPTPQRLPLPGAVTAVTQAGPSVDLSNLPSAPAPPPAPAPAPKPAPATTPITRAGAAQRAAGAPSGVEPTPPSAGDVAGATAETAVQVAQAAPAAFAQTAQKAVTLTRDQVIPRLDAANTFAKRVLPYTNPASAALAMYPGVRDSVDFLYRNGADFSSVGDNYWKVEPGSLTEKVAKGQPLSAGDQLQFGFDWFNKFNQVRSDAIRQLQAPEVRDTPEGKAFNWGATMVSDPLNLTMLPEANTGRMLLEEGAQSARSLAAGEQAVARDVAQTARTAAGRTPGTVPLGATEYYTRLATPYALDDTRTVLQRAAVDLNDPILEQNARDLTGQVRHFNYQTGQFEGTPRFEPLTGRQIRDTVIRAVARQNPSLRGQQILDETDNILRRAMMPELTTTPMTRISEQAAGSLAKYRSIMRAARKGWYQTPAEQAAAQAEQGHESFWQSAQQILGADLGRGLVGGTERNALGLPYARPSYYQPKDLSLGPLTAGKALLGSVGGAAGFTKAYAATDPNDPNRWLKVGAATAGAALASIGMSFGAGMLWRGLNGDSVNLVDKIFQPTEGLTPFGRTSITRWAGEYTAADQLGQMFEDQTRAVFGHDANLDFLSHVEETGQLPPRWQGNPDAEAWLDRWRGITAWAVQHDIVHNERTFLGPDGPAMYVPHAVADDYKVGMELASKSNRRGGLAKNPFDYYNQQRYYPTLREGMDQGVRYEENVPRVLGNYVSTALRRKANENLVQTLVERAAQNNPDLLGPNIKPLILKGEDIVQLGESGMGAPVGARRLSEVMPGSQFEHRDIYVSGQLGDVLHNVFAAQSPFSQLGPLGRALDFNAMFKHNILSGSTFHLINELKQLFFTQGAKGMENAWTMVHEMSTPGGARNFWARPENSQGAIQAMRDGLNLNMAADRQAAGALFNRAVTAPILNATGGGLAGYSAASMQGLSDDDKRNWAIAGALLGVGMSIPIPGLGAEAKSLVEHFSSMLWNRYIPFMKYTTYQMYAPGFGGQEAARFANNVFGGQNLLAMARHPVVQDVAKLAFLAPDWQEGWIRQIGAAAFDWHGPQGQMNRIYWRNAALMSGVTLEMMNQALGGKWSWENDPDATLMVNMSRLYDTMGWKHYDTYGKPYTPYLDILGPYRAMLQPLVETARAATVGIAQAAGVDPSKLPKEVTGSFGQIPAPDPGTAWKDFVSSRMGILPVTAWELKTGKDFAGRNIDRPTDPWYQVAANRTARAMTHMLPTGEAQVISAGTRGDPLALAVAGGVTGMRVYHEPDPYFKYLDQFVREAGTSQEDYQATRAAALNENAKIDQKIEAIQNGLVNKDGSPALAGQSDMTGKDRNDAIKQQVDQRKNTRQQLDSLIPADASPEEKHRLQAEMQWLDRQQTTAGTDAPADLNGRPDLDRNELYRLAWNRYPDQVADLQGTSGGTPADQAQALLQAGKKVLTGTASKDPQKALSDLRTKWLTDTAMQWDVDPAVLQDIVKAKLYGSDLPDLPGITSANLDDITRQYEQMSQGEGGSDLASTEVVRKRQEYIAETAAQHGVSAQALQERVKLRTLPLADQTPGALERSHAIDVLANSRTAAFTNPDGTPMGDPGQWQYWDQQLTQNSDKYDKRSGVYLKHLPNGQVVKNDDLNKWAAGRAQAKADQMKDVFQSPNRDAYERLYGAGANLTDKQWAQYQAGTLDEWNDPGGPVSPQESIKRHQTLLLWKSLTPQERIDYSDPKKWNIQMTWVGTDWAHGGKSQKVNHTTLTEYVKYIDNWQSSKWKDAGLGVPDAPGTSQ